MSAEDIKKEVAKSLDVLNPAMAKVCCYYKVGPYHL